ncbi:MULTISPECIES: hypothetical protein [Pseudomonas]|uniref:Lipoprotein n=1 Tax=Pseudomonas fluorescens TaxID=294 RepID=A0A166QRC9_PSEFL|nr:MULTISPECIES: hypothetical protein [Pseudomonas]KZN20735.1 hypothetical protein A1D17_04110 [Pseudomonas fluorescens]
MKQAIACLALVAATMLSMSGCSSQAQPKEQITTSQEAAAESSVVYEAGIDDKSMSVAFSTVVGTPTEYKWGSHATQPLYKCTFNTFFGDKPIEQIPEGGMSLTIVALERTDAGVRTLINLSKTPRNDQKLVLVNDTCTVHEGSFKSFGISAIKMLKPGEATGLKLDDGTSLIVTVAK